MREKIIEWLFGHNLEEYKDILHNWTKAINGWGETINLATDACKRNDRLIELSEIIIHRYESIIRNAIVAYEFELENQDYETEKELHTVVLNEFGMTDAEYHDIMR